VRKRSIPAMAILPGLMWLAALTACRSLQPPHAPQAGPQEAARVAEAVGPEQFAAAAAAGDLARVRELLQRDADLLNAKDAAGWNAVQHAAWAVQQEVHGYLLLQGARGNLFSEAALGPWASFRQRLETNPIGVDSRDSIHKATALIWAVRSGNRAGCELLLANGADIGARDREGNTVMHHAAAMGQVQMLDFLLYAGAAVDAANDAGRTALHLFAGRGSYEACRLLVERGAAVDARDGKGNTALHVAAERGDFELCEYFLFLGASAVRTNADGRTPGDLAQLNGHERVAELLSVRMR